MDTDGTTVVILCSCSGIISDRIDWETVQQTLADHATRPLFLMDGLACGVDNRERLVRWLQQQQAGRVVVAACSPNEHEATFRAILAEAGINPWYLQMVNVREQIAWVTADPEQATRKAVRMLSAALWRVQQHQPLALRTIPVCCDVAVVGAGPAGMQAALMLARAGRNVTLIEREPFIGGLPVRFEELFPELECGPCLLEPIMADLLHGGESERIRLLTLSEVTEVTGNFGAWNLTVRQQPRYIDPQLCIGCMICATVCPVRRPNRWNYGGDMAAVDVSFAGALPNLPHLDRDSCLKLQGVECNACLAECPVEGSLAFDDPLQEHVIQAGAIVIASGAVEQQALPASFLVADNLHTASSFERLLAMNGPTAGEMVTSDGTPPASLAIVCCAGSLEQEEVPYCSGVCCRAALKYAHLAAARSPGCRVTRLVKEQVVPGVAAAHQLHGDQSQTVRYRSFGELSLSGAGVSQSIVSVTTGQQIPAEMIVMMRPVVPGEGTGAISRLLELELDQAGFIAPLHPLSAPCNAPLKGVYLAGSCRGPGDVADAFASGSGAAGHVLSDLVEGRDLVIEPQVAVVEQEHCSGCKSCLLLCPYQAISWNEREMTAEVNDILCRGCGTCVAGCPSGAIVGRGFSREMLRAELRGVLS